jgi:hypothetical protein
MKTSVGLVILGFPVLLLLQKGGGASQTWDGAEQQEDDLEQHSEEEWLQSRQGKYFIFQHLEN